MENSVLDERPQLHSYPTFSFVAMVVFSRFPALSVLAALLALGLAPAASGQTPTATVENEGGDVRLQTFYNGGLLAPGTIVVDGTETDSIPAEGAGTRMMWYPEKAAFRAGRVGAFSGNATRWDASEVGFYSVAFGRDTEASGNDAMAVGNRTTASGNGTAAVGRETTASGDHAVALGKNTTAEAANATAMGDGTTASAAQATAMGLGTTASGFHATAMGFKSTASGLVATAMGNETTASGRQATAMGDRTTASGKDATAMGFFTTAIGDRTTAMGLGTTAATRQSLSTGECNSANTSLDNTLFVVGSGSYDFQNDQCSSRQDAFTVDANGSATASSHDTFSDRRLKTDIEPIDEGVLKQLAELRPVRYKLKTQRTHPKDEQIGLVAQDVQQEFPELVSKGTDGMLSLAYPKLTAVLLKGIQEQQAELETKKQEIATLKAENEEIKERLAALEREHSSALPAGLAGPLGLAVLFGLGGLGIGLLWRRRP
jgi:hypothetical protein